MLSAGGECLTQTGIFILAVGAASVVPPVPGFDNQNEALGLSRAEMDHKLLERARTVRELNVLRKRRKCPVWKCEGQHVRGVQLRSQDCCQ